MARRINRRPQVEISENGVIKVDEIQRPIVGGAWTTHTDFGRLEIKITPFWTGKWDFCGHVNFLCIYDQTGTQ